MSSTTVTDNERFTYEISVDCDCSISPPDLSGFDVLDKSQQQMTSQNSFNGNTSKSCTTTLTYVLKAKSQGKISIGKAKVNCKKGSSSSEEFSITVVDANEAHLANEGVAHYYFKIESNKKSVMVGEPFVITFSLYTDKMPEEITTIVFGDALGLWRQPLYDETAPGHAFSSSRKKVKGKEYHVIELRKEVGLADRAGNLHIDSYFGRAVERYDFFQNTYMEGFSNTLDITVKDLPGQKPETFYGMAGSFELTHEISETTIPANHTVEMKVKLEGTGNFHLFKGPEFLFPKDSFLVNGPEIEENLTYSEKGATGSIVYTYLITPTKKGEFLILPFSFIYYDQNDRKMKSVATHDFVLNVSKGKSPKIVGKNNGREVPVVETDIRYVHTNSVSLFGYKDILFGRMFYWIFLFFPLGGFFFFILLRRRRSRKTVEEKLEEEQKQTKRSTVRNIQKIKELDTKEALKQLKNSLEDYFMTNLEMGRSGLSKNSIKDKLGTKSVSDETKLAFEAIWDKIEMAQYAPMSSDNIGELVDQTEQLIQSLNKQI